MKIEVYHFFEYWLYTTQTIYF